MTRKLFFAAVAAISLQVCNAQTPAPSTLFSSLSFTDLYGYANLIKAPGAADRDGHNILTRSLLLKGWPVTTWAFPTISGVTYDTQIYTYSVDPTQTLSLNEGPFAGYSFVVNLRASTHDFNQYLEWFHAATALPDFNIDPVAAYPSGITFRSILGPHNPKPQTITLQPEFIVTPQGDPSNRAEATKPFTYTVQIQIMH